MTDIEPVSVLYISTSLSLLCREINLHLKQSVFVDHRDIESLQLRHDELKASIDQLRIHALTYKYGHGLSAASWKQVMDTSNHVVDAIKAARMAYGLGIKDARDLVIAYRDKKYAFKITSSENVSQSVLERKHAGDPVPASAVRGHPLVEDDLPPIGAPYHGSWND